MSYKEDLKINKYLLEEEWSDHSDRYITYSDGYAEAVRERDDAKEELSFRKAEAQDELDRVKAELDIEIRTNYMSYGFEKITEAIVSNWIIRQEAYKEALSHYRKVVRNYNQKLNQAEYSVNICDGARRAFEHRKIAMDNLTRLMLAGYFSSKPSKDIKESIQENQDQRREEATQNKLKESFRRRKELHGQKS